MSDAVIIKTRKFKRNPLPSRKQVCLILVVPLSLGSVTSFFNVYVCWRDTVHFRSFFSLIDYLDDE
jgi:hypothetical protein